MNRPAPAPRAGVTLVELLIAMIVASVISTALIGLFISQTRLFGRQKTQVSARSVSRTGANALLAELRMVEVENGVEAASDAAVTVRVPYALGLICATTTDAATISLLPVDSTMYSRAGHSGFAWRNVDGFYSYVPGDIALAADETVCTSIPITTDGPVIEASPGVSSGAVIGTPVLLYRRITYEFKASAEAGGGISLWRTLADGGGEEELVGPFDAARTEFNFYVGAATAQDAPPADLSDIVGLEMVLVGQSDGPAAPGEPPAAAPLTTAVFFKNRLN